MQAKLAEELHSSAEMLAFMLNPQNPKYADVVQKLIPVCTKQAVDRTTLEAQGEALDRQLAGSVCRKDVEITPPIAETRAATANAAALRLDFVVSDVDPSLAAKFGFSGSTGVLVTPPRRPLAPGPASHLIQGDIILRVNNRKVNGASDFLDVIAPMAAGSTVAVCGIRQSTVAGKAATEINQVFVLRDENVRYHDPNDTLEGTIRQRISLDSQEYCLLSEYYADPPVAVPSGVTNATRFHFDNIAACRKRYDIDALVKAAFEALRKCNSADSKCLNDATSFPELDKLKALRIRRDKEMTHVLH